MLNKLNKTFGKMSKSASGIAGITQYKIEITQLGSEIKSKINNLGDSVFNIYKDAPFDLPDPVVTQIDDIMNLYTKIEELQNKIEDLKPKQSICPSCSNPLKDSDQFCNLCGTPRVKSEEPSEEPSRKRCVKCENLLKADAQFCVKCGTKVEESISEEKIVLEK